VRRVERESDGFRLTAGDVVEDQGADPAVRKMFPDLAVDSVGLGMLGEDHEDNFRHQLQWETARRPGEHRNSFREFDQRLGRFVSGAAETFAAAGHWNDEDHAFAARAF